MQPQKVPQTALSPLQDDAERSPVLDPLPTGLFCPQCDYDLRGLTSERCPECGFSLEGVRSGESRIPWVHRAESSRFLAYWRTVGLVTLRPRDFHAEIIRPVSYRDALWFRRLTVLHIYLPLLVASVVALVKFWDEAHEFFGGLTIVVWLAGQVALLLALLAATAVPSIFFCPRRLPVEKQNRAVALSYYMCAPLACFAVGITVLGLGYLIALGQDEPDAIVPFTVITSVLTVWLILKWLNDLLSLAMRGLRAGLVRLMLITVVVPLLWILLGAATLVVIPFLALYVAVVVRSLL